MKRAHKVLYAAGALLLLLAAFFTIALMFQLLNFGTFSTRQGNMLFSLGNMLATVYGFSSALIPLFLLIAAMTCFSLNWSARKAMRLLTAVVPFFTAVITENICKSILAFGSSDYTAIKISVTIIVGAMLIVIELLGAGMIADKITQRQKHTSRLHERELDFDELPIDTDEAQIAQRQSSYTEQIVRAPDTQQHDVQEPDAQQPDASEKIDKAFDNIFDYENETQKNPDAIISEEEYSALTSLDEDDELTWSEFPAQEATPAETFPGTEPALTLQQTDEDEQPSLDPDFFDIDINEETSVQNEYYDDALSKITDYDTTQNYNAPPDYSAASELHEYAELSNIDDDAHLEESDFEDDAENDDLQELESDMPHYEMNGTSFSFAGDVFADMDKDVRKNLPNMQPQQSLAEQANKLESNKQGEVFPSTHESLPPVKKAKPKGPYKVPTDLLTAYEDDQYWIIDNATKDASAQLKETLNEFNIEADVIGIKKGPVVTMFEILPAPGVKLSKIAALQDNIALRLAASSVRIVAPIPGKQAVGIEIPNKNRSIVSFREIIEKDMSEYKKMAVPVILGKDILGKPQIIDLVKMPHLLIAGATGSGKSVCVNSMILSILYKRSPQEVKLILIDPKIVELKLYNDIPHLLVPVVTESKKAFQALQWALCEMERRYALLDSLGCRDIASYNKKIAEKHIATEKLPYIVIIIDEFADLMATTGKELESTVARLAAMSRAIGIHLVLATQRPSIDVITGLIKANIPSRIAFMVASKMDSRIIVDQVGAEKLLGRGDMLYASATDPFPVRIQGTLVSDKEVEDVVEHVKKYDEPDYIEDEVFVADDDETDEPSLFGGGEDPLYNNALEIVMQAGKASASYIQRRLKIGYNRAARLVEDMEARGIVGPANGSKPREIIHMP